MLPLDALALLDVEGGERFSLSEHHSKDLPNPQDLPWEHLALVLDDPLIFGKVVAPDVRVSPAGLLLLQASWVARHGLVAGDDLKRLIFILRKVQPQVEVDLLQHVGVDLGELWRSRRWRLLLNLIDHLPRNSWTNQALADDEEYAERVAAAAAKRANDPDEKPSTPLQQYSPEVEALAAVVDAVNALRATFVAANSQKGEMPKIPPYPRPVTRVATMTAKAERQARWSAHEKLAARLLPGRRPAGAGGSGGQGG